ncbi:MAG: AMP-binding protein [Caulobacterales bacterium]
MTTPLFSATLAAALDENARSFPDKIALVCGARRVTYPELRDRVRRLTDAMAQAGIGQGDRILLLDQNSHIVFETIVAASSLGAMVCPVNWRQSEAELAFVIDDLAPALIIAEDTGEVGPVAAAGLNRARHRPRVSLRAEGGADAPGSYEAFLASGAAAHVERVVDPGLPCLVIYTAAFDGFPNGAMLTQTGLITQSASVARVQDFSAKTTFLASGPLFHIGTHMFVWAAFVSGGAIVFTPRADAQTLCELIDREKITNGFIVGKTIEDIVRLNADGRYDLKSLQAPPFTPEWNAMITVRAGSGVGYGQTELTGLVVWPHYGAGIGVHGRPSPGMQIRIVGEDDEDAAPGVVGEIACRGPSVMAGYWNRPELNAHRQRHGWHHTNDLGRREADGTLTFIGPKTQMIKSGVENIYPAEVEGCLKTHPAVLDCAVIGVPDDVWIQSVKAIVVLRPGADVAESDLVEHCRSRIASYKKPKTVAFASSLPRLASGSIDYAALDAAHGGGNYPGGRVRSA